MFVEDWFIVLYGISTLVVYLMPNAIYIYIYIYIYIITVLVVFYFLNCLMIVVLQKTLRNP